MGRFIGEDVANGPGGVFRAGPVGGGPVAPGLGLAIEVVEVAERAGGEEAVADEADRALDPTFLVAACHRHWSGLEPVMTGEREQGRMKAHGVAATFEHGALKIVVEADTRQTVPRLERLDVAAQERLHPRIEEEAQEDAARVAEHDHERHQRPACLADGQMTKVPPIDLPLFAGQRSQALIGLGLRARPVAGDDVAEVTGAAAIAALAHHVEQSAGGQPREPLQGFQDEGQIRVDLRRPPLHGRRQTRLVQDAGDHAVMDAELAGDGADPPFLDMVGAQDFSLALRRDRHRTTSYDNDDESRGGSGRSDARTPGTDSHTNGNAAIRSPEPTTAATAAARMDVTGSSGAERTP